MFYEERMSRKRRKNKNRKASDSDKCEGVFVCRCQRTPFVQHTDMTPKELKVADLNANSHCCPLPTETEKVNCDSQDFQCKSDGAKLPSSPFDFEKPENFVRVILEDSCEISQKDRSELPHDPEEQLDNSGEFSAQVTTEGVNLNLEINKLRMPNTRTHVVITNGLKKSRSYHDRLHQHSQYHTDYKWDFTADNEKDTHMPSPKHHQHNCERPHIKLEIIGEGIEVRYKTVKQKLMVYIESDKDKRKEEDAFGSGFTQTTDNRLTIGSCCSYSDFSLSEMKAIPNCRCPEWCMDVPPPTEFADEKVVFVNKNTEDGALRLQNLVKDPISPTSSSGFQVEALPKQLKDEVCSEILTNSNENHPLQDKLHKEPFKPNQSCLNKAPFISNRELKLNPTNHHHHCRISDCPLVTKVMRRKTFPEMYCDQFLHFSHTRQTLFDNNKYSLSRIPHSAAHESQAHISRGEHGQLIMPSPSKDDCKHEVDKQILSGHGNLISSCNQDATNGLTHISANPENSDRCSLYSIPQVEPESAHVELENDEDLDDLKNIEEHIELTESGFDEDMLDSDNHTEIHDIVELDNKDFVIQVCPPSRSTSRECILGKGSSSRIPAECLLESKEKDLSNVSDLENLSKKRRGSVITVITGDLDQRVLIQCDNEANSSRVQRESMKEFKSSLIHRDSVLTPVFDVEDSDGEFRIHGSFEEQTSLIYKDISLQTSFDHSSLENQTTLPGHELVKEIDENMCPELEESNNTSPRNSSDSAMPGTSLESMTYRIPSLPKSDSEDNPKTTENADQVLEKTEYPIPIILKRDSKSDTFHKHLKLPKDSVLKETRGWESSQEEGSDRWAKKRKQFRETKNCNSAGGSSLTSNITEESGNSEEASSLDLGGRGDIKDKGLYSESFHSASWIFRGDDCSPDNSPRCLSKRPRSVAIRERTVRIAKGTGDYPWGFRIQFSKPILVTEVDTNGAAEEAGLQVGDIVMAVNGTDVTSIPHSEAACLARQEKNCSYRTVLAVLTKRVSPMYGPKIGNIHQFFTFDINHGSDILTLVVGSDISRFPNTPRPTCRGYLHKRTHSGLLKGWRKRWFVLKHDGSLQYYKHKKDEGKCRPLVVTKLEGSEIGVDTTLGKPFVFRCVPQSGNRIFYFCATSNQEMKRWLEAMDKAVHPLNQNHVWVDVTMHNTSLPPLAIKNPECLGLLHQLDRSRDIWVQHYCILKDGCLYFYASIRSTSALGGIYLQGYTVHEQAHNSRRCIIELRPPSEEFKTFYLSAGNAAENKRWITALKTSINKWLPLHQAIQDFMSRPLEETRM
ncbi:uncharacterized protein PAF06_019272 [Gastrophryne carolinensis]